MRKSLREISGHDDLDHILKACDVCHLGLSDNGQPYVVPLNYGYEWSGSRLTLYFHCADAGRKLEIIRRNNRGCFQMDRAHELRTGQLACQYGMNYECLIGCGLIEILEDPLERIHGLQVLMRHYSGRDDWEYDPHILAATMVLRLEAAEYSGKRLQKG